MASSFSGLKWLFPFLLYFSDALAYFFAFFLSSLFLFSSPFVYARFFILLFFVLSFNYVSNHSYKDKRSLFGETELFTILKSHFFTFLFSLIFIISLQLYGLRMDFLMISTLVMSLVFTLLFRSIISNFLHHFRKVGYDRHRTFFFGKNNELESIIRDDSSLGYSVVGVSSSLFALKKAIPHLDTVFVLQELITDDLMNIIISNTKITWKIIPSALNLVIEPVDFDEFKDYPIINIRRSTSNFYSGFQKRLFDIVVSGLALIILSPVFLIISVVMKIVMPGPVFFRQERLGKNLKPFGMFKFRSMVVNAEALKKSLMKKNEVEGLFKMKDDPRVTKFGHFLRRSSLDELPQLINIFLGDMSMVGPRPHLQSELHNYKAWRRSRFSVKPGLTGLWQIKGRHELNFDKAVLYDIYYARNMSLFLDLEIIVRTIPALLLNNGRF